MTTDGKQEPAWKWWLNSILITLLFLVIIGVLIFYLNKYISILSPSMKFFVMILSVGGGFGGLCYSLVENKGRLKLCNLYQVEENEKDNETKKKEKKPSLELGCIGDILIGIGGALAIFL